MQKILFRYTSRLILHPWYRISRGKTLGVRAMVLNENNEVLLITHTYAPGWLFPGGGVDRGETLYHAMERELVEEASVHLTGPAVLHGMFANEKQFRGDHVALYVVREFRQDEWKPNMEIADAGYFPLDQLPEGTTGGTKRRLDEVLHGKSVSQHW